jgi:transposase
MKTDNRVKTPEELLDAFMAASRRVAVLEADKRLLSAENEWLREQLGLNRYRLFAPRSEKTPAEQPTLVFNEAEASADLKTPEPEPAPPPGPETEKVGSYTRRKTRGPREIDLSALAEETIVYRLPDDGQVCPACSGALHPMGEVIRVEIKIIPAHVVRVKHVRIKYACRHCQNNDVHTPIVTAPMPAPAFPGSLASPSAVAYIIGQKYLDGMPLYRQEQQWARNGVQISRQTLANWVIKGAFWLEPIYDKMHERLLKADVVNADETPVQVLHEEGRSPRTQSRMWLYRSGRDGPPIVLFQYKPTRAGEHAKEYLAGFHGYLQTDGYAGYNLVADTTQLGCWAHARRKFNEALELLSPAGRAKGGTLAHVGLDYCNQLFMIERDLKDATPEERKSARLERSKPVLEAFSAWLIEQTPKVLPKSLLGAALAYCRSQWEKLVTFLEDGRLEIDNNSSERAIKPFVIGRKNWLFANTPDGADASAVIYSIVETAKENGLNPTAYVEYLFEKLPSATTSELDSLLPWSPSLPASLRLLERPTA